MKYFLIILFLTSIKYIYAQGCCTAGSSTFGGIERGAAPKDKFRIGLGLYSNSLNDTYQSTGLINDPLKRTASVTNINAEFEYGIAENLSLLAVGNYSIREREFSVRSNLDNSIDKIKISGKGFGDLIILLKYNLIPATIISPFSVAAGGGAKLPTGSFTKENNGTRLSIDMQPGTGSIDLLSWLHFYKGFLEHNLSFSLSALYKYSGTNLDGYRYGDEFLFTAGTEYSITDYLSISALIKGRFANQDFFDRRFLPSTGGTYFDFLPSITYSEKNFSLKAFYQFPVHRNIRGIQLATSGLFGTEFQYSVDFLN